MTMTFENLAYEIKNGVAYLTINRPKQLNALNSQTIQEIHDFLKENRGNKEVKVIIITGSGEKAFVAGADIKEFAHFSVAQGEELSKKGHDLLFDYVANYPKPIVAAVNGFALGGGLELAMACHIRVASDNARMGLPEVSLGVIPGYGGTQRLTQLVGKGKAMELVMTADMIKAEEALQWGLVNHVVPQADLIAKCEEIAGKIASKSLVAIEHAIVAINDADRDGVNGFETEITEFGKCFGTEDFKEGTTAFMEKRKAEFPGK